MHARVLFSLLSLLSIFIPAVAAAQSPRGRTERTFQDLGYGDQVARSTYGAVSYFFPVPRGRLPQPDARLALQFSHSPLLLTERSTMTVTVNNQSLTSVFLGPENRAGGQLVVPLPTERFTGDGYFVVIQFAMRLSRDECEENGNPALWATVHGSSVLALPLADGGEGLRLQDAAAAFTPSKQEPVMFVAPDSLVGQDLEAAGLVAFQLGRWSAFRNADPAISVGPAPIGEGPVVRTGSAPVLGFPDGHGQLTWNGQSFTAPGGTVPADQGIVAVGNRGPDFPELIVTGATPAATLDAARALVEPERRALLVGGHTVVTKNAIAALRVEPWGDGAASFAQLGIVRREVSGPGLQVVELPFERPPGWSIQDGATLELHLAVSPALRVETSWVAAAVNGFDVGTRRLEQGDPVAARARGGAASVETIQRVRFDLPEDLLNTTLDAQPVRRLALQLRFFLDLPNAGCTSTIPAAAWASILPTSAWFLPHTSPRTFDLGRFPFPLIGADAARTVVVVPQKPNQDELSAGLKVMASLGRWNAASGMSGGTLPRLITADTFGAVEKQSHLILVGSTERNAASAEAARSSSGAAAFFQPAGVAAYRLTEAEQHGTLRLGRSPWQRDRALLAVVGHASGGTEAAVAALTQTELFGGLQGQAVAVVDMLPVQSSQSADPPAAPPVSLAPRVVLPLTQRLLAWQIVGAVLLGAFVAITIILVAARVRRR